MQVRITDEPALQGLAVHLSTHGYLVTPVVSWAKGQPVVEQYAVHAPTVGGKLRRLGFRETISCAKRLANEHRRQGRDRAKRRGPARRAGSVDD